MNLTKTEFENIIQTVANFLGNNKGESYSYLIKNATLPELVKMIIYDCFLFNMNFRETSLIKEIEIIREYTEELNAVGFVTFK